MSKVQMIVVDSGELYVFGKLISRHPDFPWLFSITDVYKACEKPIRREAVKYEKDPETTYKSKRPGAWIQWNTNEERIDNVSSKLRKRISKYGVDCGFGKRTNTDARRLASVSNRDLCIQVKKGGTTKGTVKAVQGTYVAQDLIILYAGFLNEKLRSSVYDVFISVLNGYTEEVVTKVQKNENRAKGTQARADNIEFNHRLVEACGLKKLLPMHVQRGINEGVLGMTATKYKKLHDIKEPFNDNITEDQVDIKNAGIAFATLEVRNHPKSKLSPKEGQEIGKSSGAQAQFIRSNKELSKFVQENPEAVRKLMEHYLP
jgi:hypothetical protein